MHEEVKHDIEWNGFYEQFGNKNDVTFQNMQITQDGTISGGGKDPVGDFTISGSLTGSDVAFKKQYVGQHAVDYKGKLDQGAIKGTWDVFGQTGTYEIKMKTKQWKGFYEQHSQKTDVLVSLDIADLKHKRSPIRGIGSDQWGNYVIEGFKPVIGDGHTVLFMKKYFGQKDGVVYSGVIGTQNGAETIRGAWVLGNDTGAFELVKQN